MAKSVSIKFSDGKRPSKLLLLQYSTDAQKLVYGSLFAKYIHG